MSLPRRRFLHLVSGAVVLPAMSRIATAQTYPTRPVRIIVGFAAGGSADIVARLMGQWLSERLGRQFVVENRIGAGTNFATEAVAHAAPDGYTLLLVNPANAINATLYKKLNFDFIRDVGPVAGIFRAPIVMVVNGSFPAKTVPEFIAYAKPIRARSIWPRLASAQQAMLPARCSGRWPASIWFTYHIVERRP
jgi:tripartite-type tricarboxylate transporter receptor subunit TctC